MTDPSSTEPHVIGVLAARAMERVEERGSFVRSVMLAVEYDDGGDTGIVVFSHEDRSWVQLAFIKEFRKVLKRQMKQAARALRDDP